MRRLTSADRYFICGGLVLALFLVFGAARPAQELTTPLSDETFWRLVTESSEPGGSFVADNFVSNELSFQHVLPALTEGRKPGGAYLGVGPDQNFTYIIALKPKIAFVVDIRRQNMVEHLLFKALIEVSTSRADFLSRLFSRPGPADIDKTANVSALFGAFHEIAPTRETYEDTLSTVTGRLVKDHHFELTAEDSKTIEYLLNAFYYSGPDLT